MEFLVLFNTLVLILAGSLITYNLSSKKLAKSVVRKKHK